jgi:hypothetical protein
MKGPHLALLAILLFLPFPALASDYMTVETMIMPGNAIHSALTLSLDPSSAASITLPIFGNVNNLKYDSNFEGFSCTFEDRPYGKDAVCDISNLKRSGSFKVEFDSDSFISKTTALFDLKQQISTPVNLSRLTFRIVLPEGAALADQSPYIPFDAGNSTDGRNIYVYWSRDNVVAGEVFNAEVKYQTFSQDQNVLIAGIFGLIALVAIAAIVFRRKFNISMALPVLRPDEKIIMEKVLAHKSGVNQKIVVQESGYSKAKVSKVLKSLEERGVVKLERLGRSNKIFLQSKMENKGQKPSRNNQKA